MDEYSDAKLAVKDGESLETIREYLRKSIIFFENAVNISNNVEKAFEDLLDSRKDCLEASADIEAKDLWENAEDVFHSVMKEFEAGDVEDAKEYAREAEITYIGAQN